MTRPGQLLAAGNATDGRAADDMVDWDLAVQTARRMMKPGPQVSPAQAREAVEELRSGAAEAEAHVRGYTGLQAEAATAPVVVVDRPGWVQANADGLRVVLRPLAAKMRSVRSPGGIANAVGPKVTGVEAGTLLGFLASKVLGQFDPFWPGPHPGSAGQTAGRLLLVAPNIVQAELDLAVDPREFRLWVCLHEETHRVQFTAVPWLTGHIHGEIAELLSATEIDPGKFAAMLREGAGNLLDLVRGKSEQSLLDLVQTPEQRKVLDRLTAVMSLLEGHADVVMDGVGPAVIPSVETIRERFQERRKGSSALDQMLRRLLGLEAKMRQYRDGAAFVRGVVDKVGIDGFNAVWTSPDTLPSSAEVADPGAWVRRVHG
ncbi:MAG TPA: zinc-dependent metalloprotease [Nocardioidaceae bacterium]|jgi:coenzyme F420 biosynthesis associated uncharacterized protein|nr:zinc-dependent metalloprotease [Nocardioidaceae bacterium]